MGEAGWAGAGAAAGAVAVRLAGVRRRFGGVTALAGVDLEVRRGEAVAVIGPSGAGKTTLFRLLNLTLRPEGGRVEIEGEEVGGLGERGRRRLQARIGTVYQQHNLVGRLSVLQNVLAGELGRVSGVGALRRLVWPGEVTRVGAALAAVGLGGQLGVRADRLSGGQQQRVAIARMLVQDPALVLADEPVASVDPRLAAAVVGLLVRLARERGKTLLVSLHTVGLALEHFPRVVGLRGGRVMFDRAAGGVTEGLLRGLYAGAREAAGAGEEEEEEHARRRVLATCRPLP